jgi:NTE family protein
LQGGGALGSYQAGVYEALSNSDYVPDWVAGISIGAINAAIIAGNAPKHRVTRLREFWEYVTAPSACWPQSPGASFDAMYRRTGAFSAMLLGQPGLFELHRPAAWLTPPGPISYYDTTPLRETLERLVDFDRINSRETRFSVGAVDVETGNFSYFDNAEIKIRPEHVMASGALAPAFSSIEIDGAHYWDGGLVSNTPSHYVLDYYPRRSLLAFQVDVFPSRGSLPSTLEEVSERVKEIQYSSRTRLGTDTFRAMHDIRHNLETLLEKLPARFRNEPEIEFLRGVACVTTMDIAQLIYRPDDNQGSYKDYDFSRRTMEERWARGRSDTERTLTASPWLAPAPRAAGARTFDVTRDASIADKAIRSRPSRRR